MFKLIQRAGLLTSSAFALSLLPFALAAKPVNAANLVRNGSFEEPLVTNSRQWDFYSSIPGWSLSQGNAIEVQKTIKGIGSAADGVQHVELDSNQSSSIFQYLSTEVNRKYSLRFAFSARPGTPTSDNILGIKWDGYLIGKLMADGTGFTDSNWKNFTYTVTAKTPRTRLEFADLGKSNSVGTYIDNVSVKAVDEPTSGLSLLGLGALGFGCVRKRHKNLAQ